MSTNILREAETDLAELASLPGEIRTKVKAALAELKRLRDAIDATIATMTGGARETLASLQAMAAAPTEPEGGSTETEKLPVDDAPPSAEDGKPSLTV